MGFFDRFTKRPAPTAVAPPPPPPIPADTNETVDEARLIAVREAMTAPLHATYGDQLPFSYAAAIQFVDGGPDPLDAVEIYWSEIGPHWHYVSYGLSELYQKESPQLEVSGWGFELTFRLAATRADKGTDPAHFFGSLAYQAPTWPIAFLNRLARSVVDNRRRFQAGDFISRFNSAIDPNGAIGGAAFVEDPQLGFVQTPNGRLRWLQVVGLTAAEGAARKLEAERGDASSELMARLRKLDPLLTTRLELRR